MSNLNLKDVCYAKKYINKGGQEKTQWIKIGTSFEKDGKQSIEIHSMPLKLDDKFIIHVFEKKSFEEPF